MTPENMTQLDSKLKELIDEYGSEAVIMRLAHIDKTPWWTTPYSLLSVLNRLVWGLPVRLSQQYAQGLRLQHWRSE